MGKTRDALMLAVLALKFAPAPSERARIIALCESEAERLRVIEEAGESRLAGARAARAGSGAVADAARENGKKGGRPKKPPAVGME